MTHRPNLSRGNARFGFRSLMLARWLAIATLPAGVGAGCGWISLIGSLDASTGSDGGGTGDEVGTPPPDAGVDFRPTPTPIPGAHAPLTGASKLDLLFMIDDSASMGPLQQKMRDQLPAFMNVLETLPGGLPDLHVAVVSSSLGAGVFSNVPGCGSGTSGNLDGAFQHPAACTMLNGNQHFINSVPGTNGTRVTNFTGDITDAISCITNLGQTGCGFEHQFESVRFALEQAQSGVGDNVGFLRPDAFLAIVMLTNEDDCSVPPNSMLFDPGQQSLADPLGGLQSYRCNEFGHLCNGFPPPHLWSYTPQTLTNCTSAEDGVLVTVEGVSAYLKSLKSDPSQIFVAALAGSPAHYTVAGKSFQLQNGVTEIQPTIQHSCSSATGDYADPAVRVAQLIRSFGPNGVFENICADDLAPVMTTIAKSMVGVMAP
jgi:hypothetical protein